MPEQRSGLGGRGAWTLLVAGVTLVGILEAYVVSRLGREQVRLRLGWLGGVAVPLRRVASATAYAAPVLQPFQLGVDFDPATGCLSLVRSSRSPHVLLELDGDVLARYQVVRHVRARAVLVSVNDASPFVSALDAARP